jgi:hypothetical protein
VDLQGPVRSCSICLGGIERKTIALAPLSGLDRFVDTFLSSLEASRTVGADFVAFLLLYCGLVCEIWDMEG